MGDKPLPAKEAALFKQLVRCYETKQNKRGLKNADAITKHKPLLPKKSQQPQFDGVQADEAEGPAPPPE